MEEQYKNPATEEQEIDLIELGRKIWSQRRWIYKVCGISVVVALIIAFSIPKEYKTTVILAPSNVDRRAGVAQLAAAMSGNLQSPNAQDLSPIVYPDIVASTPFLLGLFDVPVKDSQKQLDTSFYTYLDEHQKKAWWKYIISAPFKLLKLFSSTQESGLTTEDSGIIVISKRKADILEGLKNRIFVSVDEMTGVITLSSTMQSPEISALMADTVKSYMQSYIISYRTQKARQDLNFTETLYQESKENYYRAQQTYAAYVDENHGIISAIYRTTQERLQNEMNLAYGLYNQMSQQLQLAKIKEQDMKPVYAVVQPAVVPVKAAKPRKLLILVGCVFLAFVGACGWILFKDYFTPQPPKGGIAGV